MGIFLNDTNAEMVLLEGLGFLGLILLGRLFVQLIHWDNAFQHNQAKWLRQLQISTRQLRNLRRTLEKAQNSPGLQLPPAIRQKWRVVRWIATALSAAPWARS